MKKNIEEPNISQWRRTVCGDLSSVFRPFHGERFNLPQFIRRDPFIESIHKAKFKDPPANIHPLSHSAINQVKKNPLVSPLIPKQETGIRSACALPYELYAEGQLNSSRDSFEILLRAGDKIFGQASAGSPFHVYAPGLYENEVARNWDYAVKAGDRLVDNWPLKNFESNVYHLRVYGPNGFFREFKGNSADPMIEIFVEYETNKMSPEELTGNIVLKFKNHSNNPRSLEIVDNAYKSGKRSKSISGTGSATSQSSLVLNLTKSWGWYDFTVKIKGTSVFEKRYAGRVETGKPGKTDPFMGRAI